jgi:hypothetical protein
MCCRVLTIRIAALAIHHIIGRGKHFRLVIGAELEVIAHADRHE